MKDKTYKKISALRRSAKVFKMLSEHREPVTVVEIARAIGESSNTVICHLITWECEGFIRCIDGRYELGMEIAKCWARKKSQLEGNIDRVREKLNELECN